MAPSSFILITLFSALAMVASITESRMVPGLKENWQGVAKDEAIVEAIEHLKHGESTSLSNKKRDCHSTHSDNKNDKAAFVRDFEPRPNISAYPDDAKKKDFLEDFEPRPNVTAYPDEDADHEETKKDFVNDFEPRPDVSVYQG